LSLLHINIRSLNANINKLKTFLYELSHQFGLICITESWLTNIEFTKNSNFYLPGYTGVSFQRATGKLGGGICLYVRDDISFKLRSDLSNSSKNNESFFIEIINQKGKNSIICTTYRPPDGSLGAFQKEIRTTLKKVSKEKKDLIITGDFNVDCLKYSKSKAVEEFYNDFFHYGLVPLIHKPTRVTKKTSTGLDNIFTNSIFNSILQSGIIKSDLSDHFPIFLVLKNFEPSGPKHSVIKKRQITEENKVIFNDELSLTDWSMVYAEQCTNTCYDLFLEKFLEIYNKTFPVIQRRVKIKTLLNPWFTKGFLKSSKMKQQLYNKYLKSRTDSDHENYRHYRNLFEKLKLKAKETDYKNKIEQYQGNAKKTWATIKEILGKQKPNNRKLPNLITVNKQDLFAEKDIATHFNEFFVNIGPNLAGKIEKGKTTFTKYLLQTDKLLPFSALSPEELDKAFYSLQKNKSPGHDGINSNIISVCYGYIRPVLCDIFNKSLINGVFPESLKIAKVVPVFKSGDPTELTNYRPISILPVFSKLIERVMYNRIFDYVSKNDLLYQKQFGFQKNSSTEHALLQLVEDITKSFEKGFYTLGVFIDLSKAFDTVDQKILLSKLKYYGITGKYHDWLYSYLTNRRQFVTYEDSKKTPELKVTCGVPQGSILGPLLFLLYVNDLYKASKVLTPIMFADDTNLFYAHKNLNVLYHTVNSELQKINEWFKANKLSLNLKKLLTLCSTHFTK